MSKAHTHAREVIMSIRVRKYGCTPDAKIFLGFLVELLLSTSNPDAPTSPLVLGMATGPKNMPGNVKIQLERSGSKQCHRFEIV